MTTGRAAEDSELMLQADYVYVADIEEIRGTQIGRHEPRGPHRVQDLPSSRPGHWT